MVRTVIYLLVSVFLIAFLRAVIGLIGKAVAGLFEPSAPRSTRSARGGFGGELKKDPVCGTFVSVSSSLQKTVGGETYHFCSPACRDKFTGSG